MSFRRGPVAIAAALIAAFVATSASGQADEKTGSPDTEPASKHAERNRIFGGADSPVLADEPRKTRRKLGPALKREVIPESWVLVPDRYPIGSHKLHLHLLGYIKLDGLHDVEANGLGAGFPNSFLSSQIPPKGSPAAATTGRWGVTPNSSRLEIGLGTPTPIGNAGVLLDFNFMNNLTGPTAFLVRQLYAEVGHLRFGQSWTTFVNVESIPSTLDYQGPNAIPEVRQPLVRWTQPLGVGSLRNEPIWKDLEFVVAAEDPDTQLSLPAGVSQRNPVPDLVANLRWQRGQSSIWLAGIYRRLGARGAGVDVAGNGWGIQLCGNFEFEVWPNIQFGFVYGKGLGRYLNDTAGLDLDGMVTSNGDLEIFPALGTWIGIQHWWMSPLRSTFTYSYVHIWDKELRTPPGGDPNGVYRKAHYASANLIYSPIPPLDIGFEYIFGNRGTTDGRSGFDQRIQMSLILHFSSGPGARSGRSLMDRLLGREGEAGKD